MPLIPAGQLKTASLQGAEYGATISLILDRSRPGQGPRLHRHPYDETWLVQTGSLTFQLGDTREHAGPGDIVIVPACEPHKFINDGPGPSQLICIHASPTIIGETLE